jgi:acyl-CoA reductase-like NAD-dependent aldehyde dehydrogenase
VEGNSAREDVDAVRGAAPGQRRSAANATEFGLTASVWTGDDALANTVTGQLVAGTVSVNCHGMAAQDPRVLFGGVGQSGLGRELGVDGIRAFTQARG